MVGKELKSGAILLSSLAVSRWSEAAVIIGEIKRGLFFFLRWEKTNTFVCQGDISSKERNR